MTSTDINFIKSFPQQHKFSQKMNQTVYLNKKCEKLNTTSNLTLVFPAPNCRSKNAISTSNNSIASLTNTNGAGFLNFIFKV